MTEEKDRVAYLTDLYLNLSLPPGVLDEEIDDTACDLANKEAENIKCSSISDQLKYLLNAGYRPSRLEAMLRMFATEDGTE